MGNILRFLIASYSSLCTRRMQPTGDDCAVQVQGSLACLPLFQNRDQNHFMANFYMCTHCTGTQDITEATKLSLCGPCGRQSGFNTVAFLFAFLFPTLP